MYAIISMSIKISDDNLRRRNPFWMVLSPKGKKESYFGLVSFGDKGYGIYDYDLDLVRYIKPGDIFHDGKHRYVYIGKGKRPVRKKWLMN